MQILTRNTNTELVSSNTASPTGGATKKKSLSSTMQLLRLSLTPSRSSSPTSAKTRSAPKASKSMLVRPSSYQGSAKRRSGRDSQMKRNKSFDASISSRDALALAKRSTAASRRQMGHSTTTHCPRMIGSKPSKKYAGDGAFRN